jgi:hypothetical protein
MPAQAPEIIKNYDVLFAVRTGLTVLIPKIAAFDCGVEIPVQFKISPDNPRDLLIMADGKTALLKDVEKNYLDEAISRGSIMFYELKDDEVVRCTPCSLQAAK